MLLACFQGFFLRTLVAIRRLRRSWHTPSAPRTRPTIATRTLASLRLLSGVPREAMRKEAMRPALAASVGRCTLMWRPGLSCLLWPSPCFWVSKVLQGFCTQLARTPTCAHQLGGCGAPRGHPGARMP
jgi:hypothetical protein